MSATVLIVEDQPAVATALELLFELHGLAATTVRGAAAARRRLEAGGVAVVVQDMNFSPGETSGREGVELFRALREADPALPVVLLTAWTSLETAVQLVKEGAADYLAKPWDDERLAATVEALVRSRTQLPAAATPSSPGDAVEPTGLVWASAAMGEVVRRARQTAASDVPVLVTGPSGAGKERIAELVQSGSARRGAPFLRVNAGALPDELLEAELFGAEAGAYTGLRTRRIGRFEAAHGGTLFLDEIGNLSASGQRKLLRVLQSGELQRLGASETRRVDVRTIAATNVDLAGEVRAGRFREDLYYRLAVVEIRVPALADRPEDVLPIARAVLARLPPPPASAAGQRFTLAPEAEARLLRHRWPGNVRELENTLRRAVVFAAGPRLEADDLELVELAGGAPSRADAARAVAVVAAAAAEGPPDPERLLLERALADSGGVVARAAERLGMSRQALYRRLEKHGLALRRRLEDG